MSTHNITEITTSIFGLLSPLSSEERQRIVNAVFMLLGDSPIAPAMPRHPAELLQPPPDTSSAGGPKARQWLSQHHLPKEKLEKTFYFQDGKADVHLTSMLGSSKREQTVNCYLVVGAKSFIETDAPTIKDSDAIALCKHVQAYDKNNHTSNRASLGNYVMGSRADGFTLTGPGLKAAAELLLALAREKTA